MDLKSIFPSRRVSEGKWVPVEGIKGFRFVIKPYQRGYRWKKSEVGKLLHDIDHYIKFDVKSTNDLLDYIAESCDKTDKVDLYDFYCIQALSVKKDQEDTYELIDGQQRLTTLALCYELIDGFVTSSDERADNSPYKIVYRRAGGSSDFDLTERLHNAIPRSMDGIAAVKAYKTNRTQAWFDQYKAACKKAVLDIGDKAVVDSLTLDLHHMAENVEQIIDFIFAYSESAESNDNLKKFLRFVQRNLLFLWYEIPEHIDAVTEFTDLNSKKIRLTNAELIKALVLKSDGNGRSVENDGNRWEAIEQGLCQSELWAFIGGEDRATRIDLLLDLYARNHDLKVEMAQYEPSGNNEHALFDWYEALHNRMDQLEFSQAVIKGLEDEYGRICEWYDDVEIYHYVGLLTGFRSSKLTGHETQEKLLQDIFKTYSDCRDQAAFVAALKGKIKEAIVGKAKGDSIKTIEDFNDSFSYEDTNQQAKMKATLWLLNAWETIEAAENNIEKDKKRERKATLVKRLPFSQINGELNKRNEWTLEHIMPQNPDSKATKEDKEKHDRLLEAAFDVKLVKGDNVHKLGNMALLTRQTNSALQNENLQTKREHIVRLVGEGEYVPGSSVNVFSMYYNMLDPDHTHSAKEDIYWTESDETSYLRRIGECLKACGILESEKETVDE